MTYHLGVDVGTSDTVAAVCRVVDGRRGEPEVVPLGVRGAAVPSVLHESAEGTLRAGEPAQRRASSEPDRVAAGFHRSIGPDAEPVPFAGGTRRPESSPPCSCAGSPTGSPSVRAGRPRGSR